MIFQRAFLLKYDYIIVGAGSAGCVLANRLSNNPNTQVLLIEAGGRDWNPFIHMPAGIAKLTDFKGINWDYYTQPEPHLNDRKLYWPRGKVIGGSSSINAMCYSRGHPIDYNEWAKQGNDGWSYQDVLPYFIRSENNTRGPSDHHGDHGPLHIQDLIYHNPTSDNFLEASQELNYPATNDFNGSDPCGFGFYQVTQHKGRRCSSAAAYLKPALNRQNLTLLSQATATRIIFDGKRAVSVELSHRGKQRNAEANQEIILCGGAINSPQLLMVSGVGDPKHLQEHDIKPLHDLPGVGQNMQDHLDICTLKRSTQANTYARGIIDEIKIGAKYYLFRKGEGTSNVAEAGGFIHSSLAQDARPDIQFHYVPALLDDHGKNKMRGYGFTLHACYLQPRSRGHIRLASADIHQAPLISPNYLSAEPDLEIMLEALKISRKLLNSTAFDTFRGEEVFPGENVQSDSGLKEFIRRKAETIYHPVGTCKMGIDDTAVVNPQLQVHGLDGIRIVDASIMPQLICGNTNAPTIMIAEKAADMINKQ